MNDDLGLGAGQRFVALGSHQLVVRAGAFAFPVLALAAISAAASAVAPAMVVLILPLAVACAVWPDTHVGLLTIVVLLVHHAWVIDDVTSPWVLAVAVSLLGMHTCMAAATVVAPGSRWSATMRRRWAGRTAVVLGATVLTWAGAGLLGTTEPGGSPWLLGVVLLALAGAGAWARRHSIDRTA
jgi:MYXO-CTERM domain-containing protein